MSGWSRHKGRAVAIDRESIDTDQLIPARFMSTPRAEGYGRFLLHDLRYDGDGQKVPGFPLNHASDASVLVTRSNFGTGSSREAAVYALVDFGIKAVIAPSFGDIFASNAVNNGLLPARVDEEAVDAAIVALSHGAAQAEVDLKTNSIEIAGIEMSFALDDVWREKLINGWDDIDLTQRHVETIATFRAARLQAQAWTFPQQRDDQGSVGRETGPHGLSQKTGKQERRNIP